MARIHLVEGRLIPAPPARVHAVLADYHQGHRAILPACFETLRVEAGGFGEGTVIRYAVRLLGRRLETRARITEPEPGRKLVETDLGNGATTTFHLDPEGPGTRVRIETEHHQPGLAGWVAARLFPLLLRGVYREELENLARLTDSASG
ncbi:MAG TPA: SRPBCC family protein [Holophagaceae bacterium]|nr:SRPBCC family protein [Holophagaceae bacterium]